MHVKLEMETQPLSNLWVKLRRVLKATFVLLTVLAVNVAGVIFVLTWIPNHVRKADAPQLAWATAVILTGGIWLNLWAVWIEHRQQARWRSNYQKPV